MSDFDEFGYDYRNYDDSEEEGFGEQDYGDFEDEEDEYRGEEDVPQFVSTFADLSRIVTGGAGVVTTHLGRVEKSARTPIEGFIDETSGLLTSITFSDLRDIQKEYILQKIRDIPHVERYNASTMIAALWWKSEGKDLSRKNFEDFFHKLRGSDITQIDLLRYIRLISK